MIAPPEGWCWPPDTRWAWRAGLDVGGAHLWPGRTTEPGPVAPGLGVFHEGAPPAAQIAPGSGGLALWAGERAGRFLSLTVDLPAEGVQSLTGRSLVTLAGRASVTAPLTLSAQLNLANGPNTARQPRPATMSGALLLAEFDLVYLDLSGHPIRSAWVDLFIERPSGGALLLQDLTLCHRPRAEF